MPIDFPSPPLTVGQQYQYNGTTWQWNGSAWIVVGTYPPVGGYVTTFNGLTGAVTGVNSMGGATGTVSMSANGIDWSGLTSGFDIIPSNWGNISAPIATSPTANDAYFVPISISRRCKVKSIATQNGATASGNSGNIYLGIYSSTLYGYPNQRLYISPSTTLTTGNFAVIRISNVDTILDPGLYWLAIVYSAASIPVAGLSRLGVKFKWNTPTSSSPVAQASVDGLRSPQGSFTLLSGITGPFTNVIGTDNPALFYTAEGI